jgi:predicted enzyme related to lactoylglutathione lyase
MPSIVHFEIPADDVERARAFYTDLFGWKIEEFPGTGYWSITTAPGAIGGGMMKRKRAEHPVTNYIDVPSVDEYISKVEQLGGKVVLARTAVPNMGWFAVCLDTEGNAFGLWQTDSSAH